MSSSGAAGNNGSQARGVIVLIGPPGAGKTTVGAVLARELGVVFTDTDAIIEATAGKTVADIFIQDGEPEFRRLERDAVATALAAGDRIIGLGGGAVMDTQTQAQLSGLRVVYLETSFPELARRVGLDRPRPLLIGTNPRREAPVLNARIRKRWLAGNIPIGLIGSETDLTYKVQQLGTAPAALNALG